MRITRRNNNTNKDYWHDRWDSLPPDEAMNNKEVYPLKFSEMTIQNKEGKILEAGCGAGRILRYYHNNGYSIEGFDYIENAINKLREIDSTLDIEVADICNLPYKDNSFDYILAFGLYHNLENNLDKAIDETARVLKEGGRVCASFRADNFQNRINDYLAGRNEKGKFFHKLNLTQREFTTLLSDSGFRVKELHLVVNMPLLYKFRIFRHQDHKDFNENLGRKEGYKLSISGNLLYKILIKIMPAQFCNLYVIIAEK